MYLRFDHARHRSGPGLGSAVMMRVQRGHDPPSCTCTNNAACRCRCRCGEAAEGTTCAAPFPRLYPSAPVSLMMLENYKPLLLFTAPSVFLVVAR